MSDQRVTLPCPPHGDHLATLLCQHLPRDVHLGFFAATGDGDPRPDAWCAACDAVLRQEGGWTAYAEQYAGEAVVCAACYDAIKRRNRRSPLASERGEAALNRQYPTL
ncbi:MAG TPA: hypothetical protein VIL85_28245 [Thermomicrobiales bacterium]